MSMAGAMALSRRLELVDPRIKVLATMVFGVSALHASWDGLAGFGVFLAALMIPLSLARPINRAITVSYLAFVLAWTAVKLGLDLWSGLAWPQAAGQAGLLGLRLAVLLLLGLNLALSTSPRSLGLALASMLRPVLRERAWRAALALALFVHFLPLCWHSMHQARTAFAVRSPRVSRFRRVSLYCQSLLRYWSQKAWKQTMGLAARGLDGPEAWSRPLGFDLAQWGLGAAVTGLGVAIIIV